MPAAASRLTLNPGPSDPWYLARVRVGGSTRGPGSHAGPLQLTLNPGPSDPWYLARVRVGGESMATAGRGYLGPVPGQVRVQRSHLDI